MTTRSGRPECKFLLCHQLPGKPRPLCLSSPGFSFASGKGQAWMGEFQVPTTTQLCSGPLWLFQVCVCMPGTGSRSFLKGQTINHWAGPDPERTQKLTCLLLFSLLIFTIQNSSRGTIPSCLHRGPSSDPLPRAFHPQSPSPQN